MDRQARTPTGWKTVRSGVVWALVGLLWCVWPAGAAAAEKKDAAPNHEKIQRLVRDLGADGYRLREQAQAELLKIGPPAVEALTQALESDDMEVRQRAKKALADIRKSAAEQASKAILEKVLWKVPLVGGLAGPLAVAGDTVLFCGADGRLCAAEARTGKRLWEFASKPEWGFLAGKGAVYAFDKNDKLCRLDLKTGKMDPKFRCKVIGGTAALADGVIYAPTVFGTFVALDTKTARPVWKCEAKAVRIGPCPAPVVGEKAVYALASDGGVAALDRRTGKVAWSAAGDGKPDVRALALHLGRVIVRCDDGVHALGAESGRRLWKHSLAGGNVAGGNAARVMFAQMRAQIVINGKRVGLDLQPSDAWGLTCSEGTVYLAAGEGLIALDANTGRQQWTYQPEFKQEKDKQVGEPVIQFRGQGQARLMIQALVRANMAPGLGLWQLTPLVIHDGVMYFGSTEGLHAVDLKTRQQLWRLETAGLVSGRPVVAGGVIYFGTAASVVPAGRNAGLAKPHLYAVRVKAEN